MPRHQIRQVSDPAPIRPVASPVDSYIRPADPARSSLHDLANGLAALDAGVSGFLKGRKDDQDKLDKIRGEAAFNRANQAGWAEAVKQGLVPANASPVFMEAYKKAQGNLAGLQLREQFRAEYLQWDGRNSNDPAAFSEFVTGFISRRVGEADPYILEGLNPHVEALFNEGYSNFSAERNASTYNGAVATQGALATETIQGLEADGLMEDTGTDYEAMWNSLVALREEALESGIRSEDYDLVLLQTVVAEAERTNNLELLDLFKRTFPGSEHRIDSFPKFKELRDNALRTIASNMRQAEIDGDRRQTKVDKARENSIMASISRILADDPNTEIPEDVIRELERYDPLARKKIAESRKAMFDEDELEDPAAMLEIAEDIRSGANQAHIHLKLRQGVIRSRRTYEHFLDRVEMYRKSRAEGGGIISTAGARRYLASIKAHTTPSDLLDNDPFGVNGGLTREGLEATHDFEIILMGWEAANPSASALEREKAIREIGETILSRITRNDPANPQYMSDTDRAAHAEEANQRARDTNLRLLEEEEGSSSSFAGPQSPAASWSASKSYLGDQPPPIETLPPEYKDYIANESQRLGVEPNDYNRAMWSNIREMLLGSPQATPNADPKGYRNDSAGEEYDDFVNVDPTTTGSVTQDEVDDINLVIRGGGDAHVGVVAYGQLDPKVSQDTLDRLIHIESAGKANAKARTSSAGGLGQFIDSTWIATVKKHRPDLMTGRSRSEVLALKYDPKAAIEMSLRHAEDNADYLTSRGGKVTDGSLYLAHFAGVGLAARLYKANPKASAENYFSSAAVRANGSIIKGKTVGQVIAWANRKMAKAGGKGHIAKYLGSGGELDLKDRTRMTPVPKAYANIPEREIHQFLEWNPDPVANHEKILATLEPTLADVVREAQKRTGIKFVAASGHRDEALQEKAVEWGWSGAMDSKHRHKNAVDLWIVEEDGTISFDSKKLKVVAGAMMAAAKDAGVVIKWGGDWNKKDNPHFELTREAD